MRFMVMHKVDASMEAGLPPSQEIVEKMGSLVQRDLAAGIFLDGAGLHRSAQRVRLRCAGGDCTVTRGPLTGENELVAGFVMIKARSMDDAIEHARRVAAALGDAEIEIGPVVEPWDLGLMAKPDGLETGRFLLLHKADPRDEARAAGEPQGRALARVTEELDRAGVLLIAERLAPSASGARLRSGAKGQRRTWVDGPFTESKELVAGFSIIDVPSRADALAWADAYAAILDGNEVDVRRLVDPS
jgi:hypothetical protein